MRPALSREKVAYILVGLCRASPPLLDFVVLPWIAPFLIDLDITDSLHVGLYTGWLQTAYSFSVIAGVLIATNSSDRFGRKPTILFGLVTASVWSIIFPFLGSYSLLVIVRCLLGFCAAFIPAALKTHMVELSDDTTRPVFFAVSSFGFSAGLISAPAIGGLFVKPADNLAWLQGGLFDAYPYALPCTVATIVPLGAACAGYLYMQETKPATMSSRLSKRASLRSLIPAASIASTSSIFGFLTRRSVYILTIWFSAVLLSVAYGQIEVIFYYTPRILGGMGFTTRQASIFLSLRPLLTSCWLLYFYPRYTRANGPERVLLFAFGWPVVLMIYIFLSSMAQAGAGTIPLITGLLVAFCCSAAVTPIYLACEQIIAERAPQGCLAKQCAADEILASFGGGIGAALGPSLFAATLGKGWIVSKTVWIFFMFWGTGVAIACSYVTADRGEVLIPAGVPEAEGLLREPSAELASSA